jgi:hypothetical protein
MLSLSVVFLRLELEVGFVELRCFVKGPDICDVRGRRALAAGVVAYPAADSYQKIGGHKKNEEQKKSYKQ